MARTASRETGVLEQTKPAPPVIEFTDYPGMIEAFRAIKDHVGLSNATIERLCGWTDGHADKHLGPSCIKALSPKNFGDLMWVLAVKGTFTIDLARVREIEQHWEARCAANTRSTPSRISKVVVKRAQPLILKELGRLGGMVTANMRSPEQRAESARKAAVTRWQRHRKALREATL